MDHSHALTVDNNGISPLAFGNRSAESREHGITRPYPERNNDSARDAFFNDIRRIENSREWRRLQGIYQFDVGHGYEFENRLTHTIDVQNVGETIARALHLDRDSIDLIRTIAAIHDIGHMPFGHWGERAAEAALKPFGKTWTHDAAGLRVVMEWSNYEGLNLTLNAVEGLAKRYWRYDDTKPKSHFNHHTDELPESIREIDRRFGLHLGKHNHIEGQIASVSDWIAFTGTDIEDGLRVGRMSLREICEHFPLAARIYEEMDEENRDRQGEEARRYKAQLPKELAARIREALIADLVAETQKNIARESQAGRLRHAEDVRDCEKLLISLSPAMEEQLKTFGRYCGMGPFRRTLDAHGPLQQMVEMTLEDIASGNYALPAEWQADRTRIEREVTDPHERKAQLVQFACTYMTCVMDDNGVRENIRTAHPEFWEEHFASRPPAPRIAPAGVSAGRAIAQRGE